MKSLFFILINIVFIFQTLSNDNEVFRKVKIVAKPAVEYLKMIKPHRILLLGDKEDKSKSFNSIADFLAPCLRCFDINIYKTDINCNNIGYNETRNISEYKVDHTKHFPFEDNFFDVIIGHRILCVCEKENIKDRKSCGGIKLSSQFETIHFFSEVARILNKNNPYSYAWIGGRQNYYLSELENQKVNSSISYACNYCENNFKLNYFYTFYYGIPQNLPCLNKRQGVYFGNLHIDDFLKIHKKSK